MRIQRRVISIGILLASCVALTKAQTPSATRPTATSRAPAGTTTSAVAAAGVIRGRVVRSEDGRPLSRARVYALSSQAGIRETTTNADGRYELAELAPGDYGLYVTCAGFPLAYFRRADGSTVVGVRAGLVTRDIDVRMIAAPGVITGQVVDETGEPVAGARVSANPRPMSEDVVLRDLSLSSETALSGTSDIADDLGRFRLFGLRRGDYYVKASLSTDFLQAFGTTPVLSNGTFHPGSGRTNIVRVDDDTIGGVTVTASTRPVAISGHVVGIRDGGTVRLTIAAGTRTQSGGSIPMSSGGAFRLPTVFPGEYTLVARSEDAIGRRVVNVNDADLDVSVELHPAGSIRGRISFDSAAARSMLKPDAVTIRADVVEGTLLLTSPGTVSESWTFAMRELSGPASLDVRLPQGWMVSRITRGADDITDAVVDFSDSNHAQIDVRVTRQVTTVTGTVTDRRGRSAADTMVLIFAEDSERWLAHSRYVRAAYTDRTGRFSIEGLPPARYLAIALTPAVGQDVQVSGLEQLRPLAERLTVQQGATRPIALRAVTVP
jgi:protocatechuate 3,4-dioxygenase beta subunit